MLTAVSSFFRAFFLRNFDLVHDYAEIEFALAELDFVLAELDFALAELELALHHFALCVQEIEIIFVRRDFTTDRPRRHWYIIPGLQPIRRQREVLGWT